MRRELLTLATDLARLGLNKGTAGNCSVRTANGALITPSGWLTTELTEDAMVPITLDGRWSGHNAPSTEWRFHTDLYRARPEVSVVIHTHPPFSTALACDHREIPAFHYMVGAAGGHTIRCAEYATFGTQELSDAVITAMADRNACLMAHHGMLATGPNIRSALKLAVEVEELAEQYWRLLQLNPTPTLLSSEEMNRVLDKFSTYGSQSTRDPQA